MAEDSFVSGKILKIFTRHCHEKPIRSILPPPPPRGSPVIANEEPVPAGAGPALGEPAALDAVAAPGLKVSP
jgi:hypothetical protein